jgi:phage gp36-like protein
MVVVSLCCEVPRYSRMNRRNPAFAFHRYSAAFKPFEFMSDYFARLGFNSGYF